MPYPEGEANPTVGRFSSGAQKHLLGLIDLRGQESRPPAIRMVRISVVNEFASAIAALIVVNGLARDPS